MSRCRQVFSLCGGGPLERMSGCLGDLGSALIFAVHLKLHIDICVYMGALLAADVFLRTSGKRLLLH